MSTRPDAAQSAAPRTTLRVVLSAIAWAAAPGVLLATAQTGAADLRGAVVDAVTATAVEGAMVVLEPEQAGAFPGTTTGLASSSRTTVTDARGAYRFGELTPGVYRLYVSRLGYRPYSVVVELKGERSAVSVGLEAEPIALEPLRSRARARGPYVAADAFGPDTELARMMALDLRRRRFLTTDVRELTHADVIEGVTLGEPDVFRALQRLPGVSTRSDYTAELWTRGAPWAQTRVYYDGVPLFNPLHALGMLSGISSSAVGTVWFHPGVRPTAMGEGAAGVLDLRSRRASGSGAVNAQADLSLMTAGLSADQRVLEGRAGWRLTGRRSYMDWLSDLAARAAGQDAAFPYSFSEVSGHADAWVGERSSVEASFLWEGDRLTSSSGTEPLEAHWGNALVQATWSTRLAGLNVQHTVGYSRHSGAVTGSPTAVEDANSAFSAPDLLAETAIGYAGIRGSIWPDPASMGGAPWTLGYEYGGQWVDYFGPFPLPFPRATAESLTVGDEGTQEPAAVGWSQPQGLAAVWGEANWAPDEAWSVRAGLRVEMGDELANVGPVRLAPRLAVRYTPAPEVSFSGGYGRVYQYAQSLAPAGVQLASLVSTDVWLLANREVPALTADVVTAGLEASLAPGRVAALNAFARRATGVTLPDPAPGPVFDRDVFVVGASRALGVEASVRQLTGTVTGSASYSLTRAITTVDGLAFPASADRTHVLNATAMVRLLETLRAGAAFTAATGVPFTRTISDPEECAAEPGCDPDALPWSGAPNAARAPMYASLDLLVDWSTAVVGLDVGVYGQIRNVLGRENAVVYTGNEAGCITVGCSIEELRNAYERGVPRLPVIGIRVRR